MRFEAVLFLTLACFCTRCYSISYKPRQAVILPKRLVCHFGKVVNISCRLNTDNHDVKHLHFRDHLTVSGSRTVFESHIVDNKTIVVKEIGPVTMDWDNTPIYCYCRSHNVTLAKRTIYVGYPPQAPSNISCVSYNNVYMKCELTGIPARRDNLATKWIIEYTNRHDTLTYMVFDWSNIWALLRKRNWTFQYIRSSMILDLDILSLWAMSGLGGRFRQCNIVSTTTCILGNDDTPFYPALLHIFRVIVRNALGSKRALFEVEPFLIVKPDEVDDTQAIVVNSTCLNVTWSQLTVTSYDLQYIITVNSSLLSSRQMTKSGNINWLLVSNLPPYSKVNISVQCRPQHGGYLSDPSFVSIRMPQDKPAPPMVPAGAHSVVSQTNDSREVLLYWQTVPVHLQHGIIIQYRVSVFTHSNPNPVFTQDIQNISVSALVLHPLDRDLDYRLALQAKTVKGFSKNVTSAEVVIPADNKVRNAVKWVDAEWIERDTYTVYWASRHENGASIVRVYWCYGQWRSLNYVMCNTSIQMKRVKDVWKRQIDIPVGTVENICTTCMWNFGVSMEMNGINSGIVWNDCRFKKYNAPGLDDVTIHDVTDTSLTVTWEPSCMRIDYFGRPDSYELGLIQGTTVEPEQCQDADIQTMPASHEPMTKTLHTRGRQNVTVCIRSVSGTRPGFWVTRPAFIPGAVTPGRMAVGTIAGITVTFVLLVTLFFLLSACLCKKRKCFAKIHIDTSMLAKEFALLDEEKKFLPPFIGAATIKKKQGAPPDDEEPLRSSGDSRTRETVLTGNTTSSELPDEIPSQSNTDNTDKYCSITETTAAVSGTTYAIVTAMRRSRGSPHDSTGSVSRSSYEYEEQFSSKHSRKSSFEDLNNFSDGSYDGQNYLQMVYTTNQRTGCNVYLENDRQGLVQNVGYATRTKCKCDRSVTAKVWKSRQIYADDFGINPYSSRFGHKGINMPTAPDTLNRSNTVMTPVHYCECQCMYCLGQRQINNNPNPQIRLSNGYVMTNQLDPSHRTIQWPETGLYQCWEGTDDIYSVITSEVESNDPILQDNSNMSYVKMSNDDVLEADMSNGNVCEEYSRVALCENT